MHPGGMVMERASVAGARVGPLALSSFKSAERRRPRPVVRMAPDFELIVGQPRQSFRWNVHDYPFPLAKWHYHPEYELHLIQETSGKMFRRRLHRQLRARRVRPDRPQPSAQLGKRYRPRRGGEGPRHADPVQRRGSSRDDARQPGAGGDQSAPRRCGLWHRVQR